MNGLSGIQAHAQGMGQGLPHPSMPPMASNAPQHPGLPQSNLPPVPVLLHLAQVGKAMDDIALGTLIFHALQSGDHLPTQPNTQATPPVGA